MNSVLLLSMPSNQEYPFILFGFILVLGILVVSIFYLKTLQSLMQEISPKNQRMPPSNVWLLLIPIFGIIWHFIMIGKIADSLKAEALSRNITNTEDRPGYNIGIAMCVLNCLFIIPIIGPFARFAGLICWILYWVKMNNYKTILLTNNEYKDDIFA